MRIDNEEMKKELEIEIESNHEGGCGSCGSSGGCGSHSHGSSGSCGCGTEVSQIDAFKPVQEEKIKNVKEKKMFEYICYCDKVSKGKIIAAIIGGAKTLEAVKEVTGAISNPNCKEENPAKKSCKGDILELINMYS